MSEKLAEKFYIAKKEWAKLDSQASICEESKKIILGQLIELTKQENIKISLAHAEWKAYASPEYKEHVQKMTQARMEANIKFAEVQGIIEKIKENEREQLKNNMELKYNNKNGLGG